jgi:predicted lipoprotein with Yx(FWY)xxD motif
MDVSYSRVMQRQRQGQRAWPDLVLRLAGAGLLFAAGGIHLDLYVTGYNTIPTIGWLFLLQVIAAFVLALAVLLTGNRLVTAAGALFALSVLGGYLLSVWVGLFGFREVITTAGIAAGVIDVVAFAVLAALALAPAGPVAHPDPLTARLESIRRPAWAGTAALAALSLVLLVVALAGVGSSSSPANSAATGTSGSGPTLNAATIGGVKVLTSSKGLTLYLFAPDTSTSSKCYGSCAQYWPPVLGTPKAGPGVTGTLGSIHRSDGSVQATYNGHPLYTYIADTGAGQDHGNNLNINGGLWKVIPVSG